MLFRVFLLMSLLLIAGCASSGTSGVNAVVTNLPAEKARLIIYRDNPLGFMIQPSYNLNGKSIGNSQPNGFVMCDVTPGNHKVTVGNLKLNVNLGGGSDQLDLNLQPGTTTYLKAEPKMGLTVGVITLSHVAPQQGKNDIAKLHKLNSGC